MLSISTVVENLEKLELQLELKTEPSTEEMGWLGAGPFLLIELLHNY